MIPNAENFLKGHPTPKWQQISDGIMVTVYRRVDANGSGSEASVTENGENPTNTTEKKTTTEKNSTEKKATQNDGTKKQLKGTVEKTMEKTVEKTVEKILELIKANPKITQAELSKLTGLSRRGIEWNIQQLKLSGLITRIGPDKGGHWEVTETEINK